MGGDIILNADFAGIEIEKCAVAMLSSRGSNQENEGSSKETLPMSVRPRHFVTTNK